ncbi:MAG: ABC transporter substrate-binding protein [Candidatus Latescibacteria bacterium]|nr:ABC transporter substrate-binding protein [Candidatus Latescibacterota bacterium]
MNSFVTKVILAFLGVLVGFVVLVQGLGYFTYYLAPKDPESIAHAAAFEAAMGKVVRTPSKDAVSAVPHHRQADQDLNIPGVSVPNRHPTAPVRLHTVTEWQKDRSFSEAPMLAQRVAEGKLEPVDGRLPKNPLVVVPPDQTGPYGGTWTRFANGPRDIGVVEARLAYEGLVRWDPMGREVIPNLAIRWEIADSGRVYTFWLRENIKWSDGHPFGVDDLKFWYEDVLQDQEITPVVPRDFKRGGKVMEFEVVKESVIRFHFVEPNGLFLQKLASGRGYEMLRYPAHYMKQYHPKYTPLEEIERLANEVGFDLWKQLFEDKYDWRNPDIPRLWPWVVVAPPPARPSVLERNPYYWKVDPAGNQLPYIDRMTFEIFDAETINLKAINGEIGMQGRHLQFQNYPLFMEGRKKGDYRVVHWLNGSGGTNNIALNLNHRDPGMREVIGDHRFRKALSLALNRDELNDADFFGIAKARQASPPPTSPFYDPLYEKAYTDYDPDEANRLMDEMGLKRDADGMRLRLDGLPLFLRIETSSLNNRILELVAGYWKDVGVNAEVKEEARQLFYERKRGGMHDVGVWGGADEQIAVLDPRWLIPFSDESIQAVDYARWYSTDGKRGEEPTGDIRRVSGLVWEIERTADTDGQIRLMQEILDLNRKNLWVIGTLGEVPTFFLVKNTFRNVPDVAMSGWSFRTPGNTAVECYAIEE